jgi:hypothetical protein
MSTRSRVSSKRTLVWRAALEEVRAFSPDFADMVGCLNDPGFRSDIAAQQSNYRSQQHSRGGSASIARLSFHNGGDLPGPKSTRTPPDPDRGERHRETRPHPHPWPYWFTGHIRMVLSLGKVHESGECDAAVGLAQRAALQRHSSTNRLETHEP